MVKQVFQKIWFRVRKQVEPRTITCFGCSGACRVATGALWAAFCCWCFRTHSFNLLMFVCILCTQRDTSIRYQEEGFFIVRQTHTTSEATRNQRLHIPQAGQPTTPPSLRQSLQVYLVVSGNPAAWQKLVSDHGQAADSDWSATNIHRLNVVTTCSTTHCQTIDAMRLARSRAFPLSSNELRLPSDPLPDTLTHAQSLNMHIH